MFLKFLFTSLLCNQNNLSQRNLIPAVRQLQRRTRRKLHADAFLQPYAVNKRAVRRMVFDKIRI